ncbi:MAG: primosomal protein N', partial [Acidobacteria bacterium]|nr:primosomal protein N' [Acidobacteriota bacterium]
MFLYCDVSLPVPLDQAFTYELPETLRHRVKPGARLTVPFGARRLTGVVLRCHNDPPGVATKQAMRLLDEEPVLNDELLSLGRWIASYYCAPLGEVYRSMTPLAAEMRHQKVYSLTDSGRDAARRLLLDTGGAEAAVDILRLLEQRSLSAAYLIRKFPGAQQVLRSLEKKGLVEKEENEAERDPLRAASSRLRVEFSGRPAEAKLSRAERELVSFLELHPGSHNLAEIDALVANAGKSARALARRNLLTLKLENLLRAGFDFRQPHTLNLYQRESFIQLRDAIDSRRFHPFLLHGVTGSGKTEVYLRGIETALARGRSPLLLVPEIALTPAMAGQFFGRFGDQVAILHSAFTGSERADQWRRIRDGRAGVVVGTRSGVFAPVPNLGLIIIDEEHDQSYKQEETPRYNGRDVAVVRAQTAGATVVLGSATPSLETRYNVERGKYTLLSLPERIEARPMPVVDLIDMRMEFLETRKQATFSRKLLEAIEERLKAGEQTMLLLNRRGFSSFVTCR